MAKAILTVFTTCAPEREAEFNKWYDEIHVPDILAIEGFTAARRYKVAGPALQIQGQSGTVPAQYLAVYEMDTDDTRSVMKRLGAAVGELAQRGRMFDGMQLAGSATYLPLGERVEAGTSSAASTA